jgi:hypothetical protein
MFYWIKMIGRTDDMTRKKSLPWVISRDIHLMITACNSVNIAYYVVSFLSQEDLFRWHSVLDKEYRDSPRFSPRPSVLRFLLFLILLDTNLPL